jgi:hypothetical protein
VQGGTDSSEFRIPDSELEGSLELRVPSPQPGRLTPVPSDKILFPRRMLYVEAVLYLAVAVVSFGLGYLFGRGGGPPATSQEDAAIARRVPVMGSVTLVSTAGAKRGDRGAVVIALPAEKSPDKRLSATDLRPGGSEDPVLQPLAAIGVAAVRADAAGNFTIFVPAAGNYRILVISHAATRGSDGPMEQRDFEELARYFDSPAELLRRNRYQWLVRELRVDSKPLDVEFTE